MTQNFTTKQKQTKHNRRKPYKSSQFRRFSKTQDTNQSQFRLINFLLHV